MKVRLDYSAHISVVVNVPGDSLLDVEDLAVEIAENYLHGADVRADWELDDDGIEEEDESCEAVNDY